jgi:hypothetical protein
MLPPARQHGERASRAGEAGMGAGAGSGAQDLAMVNRAGNVQFHTL